MITTKCVVKDYDGERVWIVKHDERTSRLRIDRIGNSYAVCNVNSIRPYQWCDSFDQALANIIDRDNWTRH